jgi:hypothetical protein
VTRGRPASRLGGPKAKDAGSEPESQPVSDHLVGFGGPGCLAFRFYNYRPATIRAEDLAATYAENPAEADRTYLGRELTVYGEWQAMRPLADGPSLLVEPKAGAGRRVSCHLADADSDHRKAFERRVQGMDVAMIRGRRLATAPSPKPRRKSAW